MRPAPYLAAAAVLAAGCDARVVTRVELAGQPLEYAFAVVLDGAGSPTRVTEPFGLEAGALSFGVLPAIDLRDEESRFILVGLDRTMLGTAVAGFDPARVAELEVSLGVPPLRPALEGEDPTRPRKAAALPLQAIFLEVDTEGGDRPPAQIEPERFIDQIILHVPVDPEHCRIAGATPLLPWGATGHPFGLFDTGPTKEFSHDIYGVLPLDEDHMLTLTRTHLAIVQRGVELEAAHVVRLSTNAPSLMMGVTARTLAIDPLPLPDGRRSVLVVGHRIERAQGFLWELAVEPGGLELVATTVMPESLVGVAFTEDGTAYISTEGAIILARARGEPQFATRAKLETYYADDLLDRTRLIATGDPDFPILAGSNGRLHLYNARADRWEYEMLFQDGFASGEPLKFLALGAAREGPPELWAGAQRGNLYRKRPGQRWEHVDLVYPPRFINCGVTDEVSGAIVFQETFSAMAVTSSHVHLTAVGCTAAIQVERASACVSILPHPILGVTRSAADMAGVYGTEGLLVIGGPDGGLFMSTWPLR